MPRRPRQEEERSMDSLMDAMTNVVGILLLILIVSSLGITAKVKDIIEQMPEISEEQLEEMRSSRKKALDNLEDLRLTQKNVQETAIDPKDAEQLALELAKFEQENADLTAKNDDLDELEDRVEELKPEKAEKEERNNQRLIERKDLKDSLADIGPQKILAAKDIALANPRKAKAESDVYYFACTNGKMFIIGEPYTQMEFWRDYLLKNYARLKYDGGEIGDYTYQLYNPKRDKDNRRVPYKEEFKAKRPSAKKTVEFMKAVNVKTLQVPAGKPVYNWLFGDSEDSQNAEREWPVRNFRLDKDKVSAEFKRLNGKSDFDYIPSFEGDAIKLAFKPNPERGLTIQQIKSNRSKFMAEIAKAGRTRDSIAYFFVSPDQESYEIYLEARKIVENRNLTTGWHVWQGDTLTNLQRQKLKNSSPYDFQKLLSPAEYLATTKKVNPQLAAKTNTFVTSFDAQLATIKPPASLTEPKEIQEFNEGVKENRESWAGGLLNYARNLNQAPFAASEARGIEEVLNQVEPPKIMHVRIFKKAVAPVKPREVVDPEEQKRRAKANEARKGGKLTLD